VPPTIAKQHVDARTQLDALFADLHIVEPTVELIVEAADLAVVRFARSDRVQGSGGLRTVGDRGCRRRRAQCLRPGSYRSGWV
jgi:hypothetical protein